MYAKGLPEVTFEQLEGTFRDYGMNTFIIAKEQEVCDTHTIVNLQGVPDKEFVVSFQFSDKPRRAKFAEGWPSSPEENLQRLAKAGFPMDRMVDKCSNCERKLYNLPCLLEQTSLTQCRTWPQGSRVPRGEDGEGHQNQNHVREL